MAFFLLNLLFYCCLKENMLKMKLFSKILKKRERKKDLGNREICLSL